MARVHIAAAAALALAAGGAASTALGQAAPFAGSAGPFFDYGLPDIPGKPGQPGFAPAPFLDNNAASAACLPYVSGAWSGGFTIAAAAAPASSAALSFSYVVLG